MPWPFVSRSVQYRVHYVRTLASLVASNISSDAATEIALIMLIKLLRLSIAPRRSKTPRRVFAWLPSGAACFTYYSPSFVERIFFLNFLPSFRLPQRERIHSLCPLIRWRDRFYPSIDKFVWELKDNDLIVDSEWRFLCTYNLSIGRTGFSRLKKTFFYMLDTTLVNVCILYSVLPTSFNWI